MTLASGANVGLSYVKEVTHGVTPGSPTMKALRAISRNINLKKNEIVSQERRQDRQLADMRHGFNSVAGSIGYELCVAAFDDMLEGAMSGTWDTSPATGDISLATNATGNKVIRTTGSFITDGFIAGMMVDLAGFATGGNNGATQILAVTALELTVEKTLVTDVAAGSRSVTADGRTILIGSVLNTYTMERRFTDIDQYQVFRGVAVNQMSIQIKPDSMVQGSLELLGMASDGMDGTSIGEPTAAAANSPLVAFDAGLYYDGVQQAVVTGVDITLANGRSVQPVVGSKFSPDVFEGTALISGTLTAFFENADLYNLFFDEEESDLHIKLLDPNGTDFLVIMLPRIKTNAGDLDPPQEGPVSISFPFKALVDSVTGTSMAIQRSNA